MHTSTAATRTPPSRRRLTSASLVRRTASAENWPFAGAGWFVAIASAYPASCSARIPSTAPGSSRRWSGWNATVIAPVSSSRTTSTIVPSRSRMATGIMRSLDAFPLGRGALQRGVADEQVPHDRAEPFGVRRHPLGRDRRDEDARVGDLLRRPAVAPDDAEHLGPHLARELERAHEVDAHVLLAVAPAHAEDEDAV